MKNQRCPYLGLKDDPNTALNFTSQGNMCYRAQPESPVKGAHQEQFCLTGQHTSCPVFQAAYPIPMPAHLTGPAAANVPSKRAITAIGIPVLIAGAAAFTFAWNVLGVRFNRQPDSSLNNRASQQSLPGWALIPGTGPQSGQTSPIPTEEPRVTNCPMPAGWVPYTVAPTDSLYRLSVIYGVSVEMMQAVNCLEGSTAILPGQTIFVPGLPSRTPSSTVTRVPTLQNTIAPVQPVQVEFQPSSEDKDEDVVPPTAVPPTATIAPPAATNVPPPATAVPPAPVVLPPPADPPSAPPAVQPPNNNKNDDKKNDNQGKDDDKKDKDKDEKGKDKDEGD